MAKKNDKRIDEFRDRGMDFITKHFEDMEDAMKSYKEKQDWDKAVSLYMKLADKVIPSLPTQAAESGGSDKPAWQQKIDKAKKTYENSTQQ
jgi:hypothetical protein